MIAHLVSGDTVTVFVDNKLYSTVRGTETYTKCMALLASGGAEEQFDALFNIEKAVAECSGGELVIYHNRVTYRGAAVHNVVADKLLELIEANEPYRPLANFMVRLLRNPSNRSVETFYNFMTNFGLPITDDGMVVAWKAVRSDYTDKYTGKTSNHVGAEISCDRNKVDDDPKQACSYGWHCGSLNYAAVIFGSPASGDRIMAVLLDPEHAVCVPRDHDYQKVRTCRYKVIGEVENPLELLKNVENMNPRYRGEHGNIH